MKEKNLDDLIAELRQAPVKGPEHLADTVLPRLGPSVREVRVALCTGLVSSLAAVALATLVAARTTPAPAESSPPEFTLLTRGVGPLASL